MRVFLVCVSIWLPSVAAAGGVLIVGDSIGAAYGVDWEDGWVRHLERRVETVCPGMEVRNASVSGETSAGGLRRLPGLLQRYRPDIVVLELGANDGLRTLPVSRLKANLTAMIGNARVIGAKVLLLGMRIPPPYDPVYREAFADAFDTVADIQSVRYVPFLLEGIAPNGDLMQPDGIHPNAAAQPMILDNVWPSLKPLVESRCRAR